MQGRAWSPQGKGTGDAIVTWHGTNGHRSHDAALGSSVCLGAPSVGLAGSRAPSRRPWASAWATWAAHSPGPLALGSTKTVSCTSAVSSQISSSGLQDEKKKEPRCLVRPSSSLLSWSGISSVRGGTTQASLLTSSKMETGSIRQKHSLVGWLPRWETWRARRRWE